MLIITEMQVKITVTYHFTSMRMKWKQLCSLMNEWINKVWWTHTGIVFNHKKEGILDICENTDEP